jgi:hypothetical protein
MNMRTVSRWMFPVMAALASAPPAARAQATIQRTITSPSRAVAPNSAPDAIDNMLRQYRDMWQKMSPAQQKAFLDSGGSTPEQYERVLRTKGLSAVPANPAPATPQDRQSSTEPRAAMNALDSLTTSLMDLNTIRDGNLNRVQKDGCPPEVTSRLTDLRGKLSQYKTELTGVEAAPAASQPKPRPGPADPAGIANDWFKRPSQDRPESLSREAGTPASRPADAESTGRENKLLADVLPGGSGAEPRVDPKSPEALEKKKALEAEIVRIEAEIAQLSGACAALKH